MVTGTRLATGGPTQLTPPLPQASPPAETACSCLRPATTTPAQRRLLST